MGSSNLEKKTPTLLPGADAVVCDKSGINKNYCDFVVHSQVVLASIVSVVEKMMAKR